MEKDQKSISVKDQKYYQKLEDENELLKYDLQNFKENFNWGVLWQDEEPSKINWIGILTLFLQFIMLVLIFVVK